jgi:hypothetical protein
MRAPRAIILLALYGCGVEVVWAHGEEPAMQAVAARRQESPARDLCATRVAGVPNEGMKNLAPDEVPTYAFNPPASGPRHRQLWARHAEYVEPVPRPVWVHNLEHGAVVVLYRPDASPRLIAELRDIFADLRPLPACGHPLAVMTPDAELTTSFAVVAWNWVLTGGCADPHEIHHFVAAHRAHAPSLICDDGAY